MNCRRVASLLSAYIDGELNGVEMLAIREHLSGCETCREDYESLRATKQLLSRMPNVSPREDFARAILNRLDPDEMPMYRRMLGDLTSSLRAKLSPAFATVAAVSVAFLVLGANGRTPQTYDVARAWRELPKTVALTLTDVEKSGFAEPASSGQPFWRSGPPDSAPQPTLSFASLPR